MMIETSSPPKKQRSFSRSAAISSTKPQAAGSCRTAASGELSILTIRSDSLDGLQCAESITMPAYKDHRSGRWRYRKRITLSCGSQKRILGTPATNTKKAAEHAERAHVFREMNPSAVQATNTKRIQRDVSRTLHRGKTK